MKKEIKAKKNYIDKVIRKLSVSRSGIILECWTEGMLHIFKELYIQALAHAKFWCTRGLWLLVSVSLYPSSRDLKFCSSPQGLFPLSYFLLFFFYFFLYLLSKLFSFFWQLIVSVNCLLCVIQYNIPIMACINVQKVSKNY